MSVKGGLPDSGNQGEERWYKERREVGMRRGKSARG
jgi:hypothetical protein